MKFILIGLGLLITGSAYAETDHNLKPNRIEMTAAAVDDSDAAPTLNDCNKPVGTRAQDHNSSRSNKTASVAASGVGGSGNSRAQDHNSSRSNKTASVAANESGDSGNSRAQDHNSSRSNKTASVAASPGGESGGTRGHGYNSSRSNKGGIADSNGCDDSQGRKDAHATDVVENAEESAENVRDGGTPQ